MQNYAWAMPASNLPTNYLSATALLFEQGLGDPRGCEYREIEVGTGSVWNGDGGVAKTRGWVIPGHDSQRFAVCWNGLVYPAVSVGTNANLEADVMMLVTNGMTSWRSALPEALTVQPATLQGIQGCLLLRLGNADWAMTCWLALERRGSEARNEVLRRFSQTNDLASTNEIKLSDADPYLGWANDWAWSLFDRMICAHERGDEWLALADARRLNAARPLIESACAQRSFKRQPYWDSRREKELQPYLTFLDQLPQILDDLERRTKEETRVSVLSRGLTNITDQTTRVRALVKDLDLVQARQWGQPGGVNLADDPVVAALITEGDAAVGPLLDCLEKDKRLTRSVSFGRDFHGGRTVLSVNGAAWVALQTILQAGFPNGSEMRAYWNKYKHLKIEERWYAILNDDKARSRWQEAAANIVQPVNITRYPGGFSTESPAPSNSPVPVRGQSLRTKSDPSVTDLLTRHALEVPTNNFGNYDLSACCQMADYLARWDVQAGLPVARTLSKRARTAMKYSGQALGGNLIQLSLARAKAGDPAAFDDYADWIVTTTPAEFADSRLECLNPLKRYPTNSMLQGVAERLFGRTNTAWGNLPWKSRFGEPTVESELVAFPAYRALLCRELQKTNSCGTVTLERSGVLRYTVTDINQAGSCGIVLPEASSATNGTTAQIRWCDWISIALANGKHIPVFDPFEATADRDMAIAKAIAVLERRQK